jgi:hypothetical protein
MKNGVITAKEKSVCLWGTYLDTLYERDLAPVWFGTAREMNDRASEVIMRG